VDKKMDPKKKRKTRPIRSDSFLEALRDLGSGFVDSATHDLAEGLAESAAGQIIGQPKRNFGNLAPNEALDLTKIRSQEAPKESVRQPLVQEFADLRRQEKMIFTRKEQEVKLQIKAIQEELRKLAESTEGLAQEVKVATMQVSVEPGVYHLTFLESLRQLIELFRKRVENSKSWLSLANHRAKKRSYYWSQVGQSGTKFMLSQERYMATQAG
jgi:hypothetical protein